MESINERRVVTVGIDSSAATEAAVSWALEYARSRQLPLRLVASANSGVEGERARVLVENSALLCRSTALGTEVTGRVAAEPLASAVLDAAQDSALIVLGDHFERRRTSELRAAVDAAVAWTECPVVVARSARWPNPKAPVVAALDGSSRDDAVLDAAFDVAARCTSPLVVVHVTAGSPGEASATQVVVQLAHREQAHARVPVRFRTALGPAAPILLAASRWAGLLVIGAPAPDGVARTLTHGAACPVLVTRPSVAPADSAPGVTRHPAAAAAHN